MAAQAGAAAGTLKRATTHPHAMNTYVALLNFTQQGLTNMHGKMVSVCNPLTKLCLG